MNIGTRLLLSAALAVGSTVGAAALGQTVVRDTQAEVGAAAPQSIATEGAGTDGEADAEADEREDRVAGVRAELTAAAAAGEISWDAAERVSDELGGYIRGDVSVADIA
ncbi:MAG: hypothetical protein ACTHVY_10080 [Brevibacterium yomogidense]|uniref:hypothetical protein n=1 Tax=Brevibacterium sp. Mu109 TaxID=1255669 RepID=UPI000C47C37B|nr:hypothetical protein [Brevibacterium sp. Mu109]SMX94652.1 hypothetical protein BSP109_02810 [Brevibacterium sp. Mu109]